MKNLLVAGIVPVIAIATLASTSLAADRSVALNKEIESLEPMKGIVFWPDQAKDQKDLQKSISLEFSYCLPCAVVKGKTDDKIDYVYTLSFYHPICLDILDYKNVPQKIFLYSD